MYNELDNFWSGFDAQLEKAAIASPLARVAGRLMGTGARAGSSIAAAGKKVLSVPGNLVRGATSGAKALPGKIKGAYQEGHALGSGIASPISSRPSAGSKPLTGVRRDVSKMLTGGLLGAGATYLATSGEQRKNPY